MVASNRSSFSVDPAVRGAPTDPAVRGLLGSLGPSMSPIANEAASQALKASLLSPNPNRSDCDGWFSNVPAEFYK